MSGISTGQVIDAMNALRVPGKLYSLRQNLSDYVYIDMGAANYTMTLAESMAAVKVVANVGDGTKTLTIPAGALDMSPLISYYYNGFAALPYTLSTARGVTAKMYPGTAGDVVTIEDVTILTLMESDASSGGVVIMSDPSIHINYLNAGKVIYSTHAGATSIIINDSDIQTMLPNSQFYVQATGTSSITFSAGGGAATFNGLTTIVAASGRVAVTRDGDTSDFYIG